MSRSQRPRKAYRPRHVAVNTMAIAIDGASKIRKADLDQVLAELRSAFKALREGVATQLQWSILAGSVDVAKAIERQGVVCKLHDYLVRADEALLAIYNRANTLHGWYPTALYFDELDAVDTFVDLHAFQLRQLGLAEYLAAVESTSNRLRGNGGQVTIVRDFERLAA